MSDVDFKRFNPDRMGVQNFLANSHRHGGEVGQIVSRLADSFRHKTLLIRFRCSVRRSRWPAGRAISLSPTNAETLLNQ